MYRRQRQMSICVSVILALSYPCFMHIRAAAISVHKYRMFRAAHKKQGSPSGTATRHATSGNVTEHAAFAGGTATEHATSGNATAHAALASEINENQCKSMEKLRKSDCITDCLAKHVCARYTCVVIPMLHAHTCRSHFSSQVQNVSSSP